MFKTKIGTILIVTVALLFLASCNNENNSDNSSEMQSDSEYTSVETPSGDVSSKDDEQTSQDESSVDGFPDGMIGDAASILPESWMAYPGSQVAIDWYERGLNPNSSWLIVAPANTTREEVIDYYVELADTRDDFEVISVSHGITGMWSWNDIELMIETDLYFDDFEFVQITFAFEKLID